MKGVKIFRLKTLLRGGGGGGGRAGTQESLITCKAPNNL